MSTPYQPLLVANQRQGTDLSMDPWLIPTDAYKSIYDAFQFLGVVNKRDGYSYFDSVPHAINANGNPYQNISNITSVGAVTTVTMKENHGLSNGDIIRMTNVTGFAGGSAPINGTRWTVSNAAGNSFTINNAIAYSDAYNSGTGTVSQMPYPGTSYVGLPVTCIATWIDPNNNQIIIVLDSKRAAIYDSSAVNQCLVPIGNVDQFQAQLPFLFWYENYFGSIFFTNNSDNMFYWNVSPSAGNPNVTLASGLPTFIPHYTSANNTTDAVNTCLMIKAFGSRLLLLNTNETNANTRKSTRIRWCDALVNPLNYSASPYLNPWDSVVPGQGGGYFDLTDSQYIISIGQIQTNLLIASQTQDFARWYETRQVNDPNNPFAFIPVTNSRNVNSTFGTIILDRLISAVGNTGFITVDGNVADRFDEKIPEFVEQNIQQSGFQQCFGIRNDAAWQTWLLYPDTATNTNQILVYNYLDKSWAIYRPSFTGAANLQCFGLNLSPLQDPEWVSYNGFILPDWSWEDFGEATWISNPQAQTTMLLGGDALGNVWWMNQGGGDAADNVVFGAPDNIGNPITMELITRQWFPYAQQGLASQFGYIDFLIDGDPTTIVNISFNVDNYQTDYLESYFSCAPFEDLEFATISFISQANPAVVTANDHGLINGELIYIYAVQGMTQVNNSSFNVTVIDANTFSLNGVNSTGFTPYAGDGVVATSALLTSTFWTRVNCGQTGVFHTMKLTCTGTDEDFRLHAALPWFRQSGRIYKG